jgi:hypothetical protein
MSNTLFSTENTIDMSNSFALKNSNISIPRKSSLYDVSTIEYQSSVISDLVDEYSSHSLSCNSPCSSNNSAQRHKPIECTDIEIDYEANQQQLQKEIYQQNYDHQQRCVSFDPSHFSTTNNVGLPTQTSNFHSASTQSNSGRSTSPHSSYSYNSTGSGGSDSNSEESNQTVTEGNSNSPCISLPQLNISLIRQQTLLGHEGVNVANNCIAASNGQEGFSTPVTSQQRPAQKQKLYNQQQQYLHIDTLPHSASQLYELPDLSASTQSPNSATSNFSCKRKRQPSVAAVNGINSLIPRQQSEYPPSHNAVVQQKRREKVLLSKSNCTLATLTYTGSSISDPNLSEVIAAVSIVLHCQMVRDLDANDYRKNLLPFNEEMCRDLDLPDIKIIYHFLMNVFEHGLFTPECAIIALIYCNRLLSQTQLALTPQNYRPVFISAVSLAQKFHDDSPLINVDFQLLYPMLTLSPENFLARFNLLEKMFLDALQFNLCVPLCTYASYYYECRAICAENAFNFVKANQEEIEDKEERTRYQKYLQMQREKHRQATKLARKIEREKQSKLKNPLLQHVLSPYKNKKINPSSSSTPTSICSSLSECSLSALCISGPATNLANTRTHAGTSLTLEDCTSNRLFRTKSAAIET